MTIALTVLASNKYFSCVKNELSLPLAHHILTEHHSTARRTKNTMTRRVTSCCSHWSLYTCGRRRLWNVSQCTTGARGRRPFCTQCTGNTPTARTFQSPGATARWLRGIARRIAARPAPGTPWRARNGPADRALSSCSSDARSGSAARRSHGAGKTTHC